MAARVQRRSAEAFSGVVKHPVPRSTARSPRLRADPRGESRVASREPTRYGYTSIVQVAEVGRTHRASCSPGGRKTCWTNRALARRKLEAPPDAEHEPRDGETVRGKALTLNTYALVRFAGFGPYALDTTEGVLGLSPVLPSRVWRREVLRLEGESTSLLHRVRAVATRRKAHRSAQRLVGRAFEQPRECQRSTRFGEGSTRPEKGQEGFASSALKRCRRAVRRNVIARS